MAKKPESNIDTKSVDVDLDAVSDSHAPGIVDTLEKNRVIVFSSAIILLLLLGGYLVTKQLGVQRHLKAGQMFTAAAAARSIEDLDKVVAEFSGSVSAGNALLTKADIQIDQGKAEDAIKTLNTMAKDFVGHPRHAQAYFMLGNAYHKSGDYAKARENYNEVLKIQEDGELSPITVIRLGDLELAEGKAEMARQKYEESFTKYPGNPFFSTAENRIAQLKVAQPTEIDPPKPPEPEKKVEAPAPTPAADAAEKPKAEAPKGKGKGKGKGKK